MGTFNQTWWLLEFQLNQLNLGATQTMLEELNPQPLPPGEVRLDAFVEAVTKGVSRALDVRASDSAAVSLRRPPIIIGIIIDPATLFQAQQEQ